MIIKCKMCGGDIQFNSGDTVGQCDHCGCTTTFPKLPDEQRTNLFNRANHFRRQCEFDKAMAAYEHIVEEDDTDAEAHWGIVLSKYGIEYVEDPVTHERIPTCHRAQVISILSDEDYQNALKNAPDAHSREVYEREAKRIAEIQKGILAISSQEKPYDVFICYKETDDNGSRTKDSTLAQDIYYQLINEGYKVFFSRITLEDKLGQEYEPYIFAALNSAKVMLVVGTKPENFSAVWVKNEWSRFLAIMKNDRKRVLIPCYRDMDPYDLPEELSSLQSQDMSKIGFMQDIIHGVKKVLGADKQKAENATVQTAGPGVSSLHKRAVLFLEDSDWDSATDYCDRILDIDPEYAPAYIGKVQVKNQMRREADLARCKEPLSSDPDYQKALRFADDKQKEIYSGYNRAILERIDLEKKEAFYREAVALENRAAVEKEFITAAQKFDAAGEIRDAKERAANCRAKAVSAKAEAEKAAAAYKEQMERERRERERQEEERRIAEEKRQQEEAERLRKEEELRKEKKKQIIKICAMIAAVAVLIIGGYLVYEKVIHPKIKYDQAQALLNDGKLDEAYAAFNEMLDYSDSADKLLEIQYKKAEGLLAEGKLIEAKRYYGLASGYSDTEQQIKNIGAYIAAETDYENNDFISAGEKYQALGNFYDSAEKLESISAILYTQATKAIEEEDYKQAYSLLTVLGDYSDCPALMESVDKEYEAAIKHWQDGEKLQAEQELQALSGWKVADEHLISLRLEIADDAANNEDYDTALEYYGKLPATTDVQAKQTTATQGKIYQQACKALESGDLETAYKLFLSAKDHKDAEQQAEKLGKYQEAAQLLTEGKYFEARMAFAGLEGFLDSAEQLEQCNQALYIEATDLLEQGKTAEAYEAFESISDYSDSGEIVAKMDSDYQTAIEHIENGERLKAEAILVHLTGWRDVDSRLETIREEIADQAAEDSDFDTAIAYYTKLRNKTETATKEKIAKATQGKYYQEAVVALESGNLETAYTMFIAAGDYEDAAEQAGKLDAYQKANAALAEGKYQEARKEYVQLGSYLDSAKNLETCNAALYQEAASSKENGDYAKAYELFELISGYSDSAEMVQQMKDDYATAEELLKDGKYDEANAAFIALHNYSDCETKAQESLYQKAEALKASGLFDDAVAVYTNLGEYKDSGEKINICLYSKAEALLENKDVDGAIAIFESIPDYSDSLERAKALRYEKAKTLWDSGELQSAKEQYEALGDYSDAPVLLTKVLTEMADNALASKEYATALSAYQGLEQTAEVQEREYKLAQICYDEGYYAEATAAYETLGQYELSLSKLPIARYAWADQLFNNGEYEKAAEQFALLGEMTDSATRANESIYQQASEKLTAKSYDDAKKLFIDIADYKDADTLVKECDYRKATDLLAEGKYEDAEIIFKSLGEYSNSKTKAEKCIYNQAEILFTAEKYTEAKLLYDTITYSDSKTKSKQCVYNQAEALFNERDYTGAKAMYASIDYLDSQDKSKESAYREADVLYQEKKYADAETIFLSVPGYNDSDDRAKDCHLQQGIVLMDSGDYQGALTFFESVDYENSSTLAAKSHYELGRIANMTGNIDDAVAQYALSSSLDESQEALMSVAKDYITINENDKAIQVLWLIRSNEEAKNKLLEIGNSKVQSEERTLALLAFSATGDSNLQELKNLLDFVQFDEFGSRIAACNLLPEGSHFSNSIYYTYARAALDKNMFEMALMGFKLAGDYNDAKTQILITRYTQGEYYFDQKMWDNALEAFEQARDYSDSTDKIVEIKYQKASELFLKGDYEAIIELYESEGNYKELESKAQEAYYMKANALVKQKEYAEAVRIYNIIKGYKDVDILLMDAEMLAAKKARDEKFAVGQTIKFGHYPQKAEGNDNSLVEWLVIARDGDKALILSKYVLDHQPFSTNSSCKWEKCSLRKWLNGTFLQAAFTKDEQKAILITLVDNSEKSRYGVDGGKDTKDRIFLLNSKELGYVEWDDRKSSPTEYAKSQGSRGTFGGACVDWWLRCPGYQDSRGSTVDSGGGHDDYLPIWSEEGVRPALWIDIESGIF